MRKRGWIIIGAVAAAMVLLVAGLWLYFFSGFFADSHAAGMWITRVEPEEEQVEVASFFHLDPQDVDAQVPFFAKALRDAARLGSAGMDRESEVWATCDYLGRVSGDCGAYYEFEGTYFVIGISSS